MSIRRFITLVPVAMTLAVANSASAAMVDFTDASVWGGATGAQSASANVGGVTVTAYAEPAAQGAVLTQSGGGLGVNLNNTSIWTAQQIQGAEVLTVGFSEAVTVDEVYITSLYEWGVFGVVWQDESGSYYYTDVNGNAQNGTFNATSWTGNATVSVGSTATQSISFVADGNWSNWRDDGFSVGGLSFSKATTVPELDGDASHSAVALLVGACFVLLGGRRRRADTV